MVEEAIILNQADLLAKYLPDGKCWEAKWIEGSNLRNLLIAVGKEFENIEQQNEWLRRELNIYSTYDLLEYWEEQYGIPDDNGIFVVQGKTIEQRRLNLKIKEAMEGADKYQDWEYIASLFGFNVTVRPCTQTEVQPISNPRYNIVVTFVDFRPAQTFTLYFPIYFSDIDVSLLKKVFQLIKPADCDIIYI